MTCVEPGMKGAFNTMRHGMLGHDDVNWFWVGLVGGWMLLRSKACLDDLVVEAIVDDNFLSTLNTTMATQNGMWGCKAMLRGCI